MAFVLDDAVFVGHAAPSRFRCIVAARRVAATQAKPLPRPGLLSSAQLLCEAKAGGACGGTLLAASGSSI
jgi:hypothetical protein